MVDFDDVEDSEQPVDESDLPSQERLLDALAIEQAAENMDRPTARLHLQSLAKKLRREAEALKRMEKNAHMVDHGTPPTSPSKAEEVTPSPPAAPAVSEPPRPLPVMPSSSTTTAPMQQYTPVDRFSFDAGGYNSPVVTLYVPLAGIGSLSKEQIQCNFTSSSFDLIIHDLKGKSYRLFKDNLEKEIDPSKSKFIIKSNEVRLKLAKVKESDYGGYPYWSQLTEKNPDKKKKNRTDNPQAGIMDLMKQMYEDGDDQMKKVIGETLMKQRTGELKNDTMDLDSDKYKL